MEIPGADISSSASIESIVHSFHTSWTATDVSDWLLPWASIDGQA